MIHTHMIYACVNPRASLDRQILAPQGRKVGLTALLHCLNTIADFCAFCPMTILKALSSQPYLDERYCGAPLEACQFSSQFSCTSSTKEPSAIFFRQRSLRSYAHSQALMGSMDAMVKQAQQACAQ